MVICLGLGANCLHMVQLMPLSSPNPVTFASFQSRLVLPFWHRLTQVVLEKGPLNGCACVYFQEIKISPERRILRFRSPSSYMVSDEPFPGRSWPMSY